MVRVGIIGTSWWADSMYLPALKKHPQAQVVAVCGRDYTRLQEFAQRWDIPVTYTDFRPMLTSGDLDAVIIASGNDSHYPMAMLALEAELHVLCEMPMAQTAAQAREMANMARRMGARTMVPFTHRYMPAVRYVKQLIDEGYVGQPYHLNMRYYAGYGRESKYNWRFDADVAGGGVIANLGAHWFHLARWFYGDVTSLIADSTRLIERQPGPNNKDYRRAEDSATIALTFASGAHGNLHVTALAIEGTSFGQQHMEIHGSDGTLYLSMDWDQVQSVSGCRAGEKPQPLPIPDSIWQGARTDTVHNTYKDVFREQNSMTREFIRAIVEDRDVQPDFAEGARVQALIEAAVTSADNGCRVEV